MNSKSMGSGAGDQGKQGRLLPNLRFPEFREQGVWTEVPLIKACHPINEKVGRVNLTPVSITAGVGFVSQASKFGRDISGDQYKNYIYLRSGDFAYNKGNSKRFPQGYVCQLTEFSEAAASSAFICFRLMSGNEPAFFQALFDQNVHGRQLSRYITSGARSDGLLNIRPDDFYSIKIPLPPKRAEQRKIADCLSSINSLISAEKNKLRMLKKHQKGLTQQLFPVPGETNPRLRFPEFQGDGDWSIQPLEKTCTILNNRRKPIASSLRVPGPYPYYGASGIVDRVSGYIFDEPLILVGEDGAKWGGFERTAFIADGRYWVNNHAHVLRPESVIDTFLTNYLVMLDFQPFVTGKAPPKLTLGKLKAIPIPTPPTAAEQLKIGSALSSMEAMIVSQAGRIQEITKHKKGLMQQLLPMIRGNQG